MANHKPFEKQTSKRLIFRCFRCSDVGYSDHHFNWLYPFIFGVQFLVKRFLCLNGDRASLFIWDSGQNNLECSERVLWIHSDQFQDKFWGLGKSSTKKFASKLCQFSQSPNLLICNWHYSNDLNIRTSPVSTCPKAIWLSNGLKFKWYLNNWLKKPSHDGRVGSAFASRSKGCFVLIYLDR